LRSETIKWLERIKEKKFKAKEGFEEFEKNVRAYISDTEYFLKKGDLIRAFECVVWAWAWLEIGKEYGFLDVDTKKKI